MSGKDFKCTLYAFTMRTSSCCDPVEIGGIFSWVLAMLEAIEKDFLLNRGKVREFTQEG